MTRDDVIRMAREAGLIQEWMVLRDEDVAALSRFAAAEREACAKVCEEGGKDESGRIHVQAWGCAKDIRARGQA